MRICIDAVSLTSRQPGGYQTYVRNLVAHLPAALAGEEVHLLVDGPIELPLPTTWKRAALPRRGGMGFIWREQIAAPRYAARERCEVFHAPAATAPARGDPPLIVTLYDTIEFSEPLPSLRAPRRWSMRVYSRLAQAQAARRATRIITISEYSRRQIAARFGRALDDIACIHLSPASRYQEVDTQAAQERVAASCGVRDYVLAIASSAPRKNTAALLRAYAGLDLNMRSRHPLLLVCTHEGVALGLQHEAAALGIAQSTTTIGSVSDELLLLLYNAAAVFAFPSRDEGFGLPPLEAMACGTPVIAANAGALPEVLGDAALLVAPDDAQGLSAALSCILADAQLAAALSARGLAQAARYAWGKTAAETARVYRSVCGQ